MAMYTMLSETIKRLQKIEISDERKAILEPLKDYLREKNGSGEVPSINFICTHNSRRSQFAQIWAHMAAKWFEVEVNCFSGGVEVTAFNINAINALRNDGFEISVDEDSNPTCFVRCNETNTPLHAFSKLFDHEINPKTNFAAVMTCSDADVNCPFIPGTEKRISLLYDDPKEYDNTPLQDQKYKETSDQIGAEMLFVFTKLAQ